MLKSSIPSSSPRAASFVPWQKQGAKGRALGVLCEQCVASGRLTLCAFGRRGPHSTGPKKSS